MTARPVTISVVTPTDPDFVRLRSEQEAEWRARYADLPGASEDVLEPASLRRCLLALDRDDQPVGCAVLTEGPDADGYPTGEAKRVFVRPGRRGQRIAEALMAALLEQARELGQRRVVLATGPRQPEAEALYRRTGWRRIPNYGGYARTAAVHCYERVLWTDPPPLPAGRPVRHRPSARAVVLDPENRVLLTHNVMRTEGYPAREHWALPGGGVEPGEAHAAAAARELGEETGLAGIALTGPVVRHEYWVVFEELVLHQIEELYWGRSEQIAVSPAGAHDDEDYLVGLRWWPAEELRDPDTATFPRLLADLVDSLVRHGTPSEPFRIVADSTVPPGREVN